jgi:hypothetical protein
MQDAASWVVSASLSRLSCPMTRTGIRTRKPSRVAFVIRPRCRSVSVHRCTARTASSSAPIWDVLRYRTTTAIPTVAPAGNLRGSVTTYVSRTRRTRSSVRISDVPRLAANASRRRLRSRIRQGIRSRASVDVTVRSRITPRGRNTVRPFSSSRIRCRPVSTSVVVR